MELLPGDIIAMIGCYLEFHDDWLNFALTSKFIWKHLTKKKSRPQVDIILKNWITNKADEYSMRWRGKYTHGDTWCRGSVVYLNRICKCEWYKVDTINFTVFKKQNWTIEPLRA